MNPRVSKSISRLAKMVAVGAILSATQGAQAQSGIQFFWRVNSGNQWVESSSVVIGGIGSSRNVQLWMRNAPIHHVVNVFVGWGDASTNRMAPRTDSARALTLGGMPLSTPGAISGSVWGSAITLPGPGQGGYVGGNTHSAFPDTSFLLRGGIRTAGPGSNVDQPGTRPWGLSVGIVPRDRAPQAVGPSGVLLMTLSVRNNALFPNQVRNMVVWGSGSGASDTTYVQFGATRTSFNGVVPLSVQSVPGPMQMRAVPEPGTMIALGAGIAALVVRRRRKSVS